MSIDIRKPHSMRLEDAQQVADELASDLSDKFSVNYGWEGDTILFKRPGVDGEIDVDEQSVRVRARLAFLFTYLQPAVEREINRYLDEHFE